MDGMEVVAEPPVDGMEVIAGPPVDGKEVDGAAAVMHGWGCCGWGCSRLGHSELVVFVTIGGVNVVISCGGVFLNS